MKHNLNDLWEEQEGSKKVWKLQAINGIFTFYEKKDALKMQKVMRQSDIMKLTKEQKSIIADLCIAEFISINKFKNNKFIDKKQLEEHETKVKEILELMTK